ncbi:MAG: dTDP-4-dehydrorhamnose 3,5-epimerase [Acidobacteriota bacterium]
MKCIPCELPGVYRITPEPHADARGLFARTFCAREFADFGLEGAMVQSSTSFNRHKGTLRGMHFQLAPHAEVKLVRCVRGSAYDVVLDLRTESPTYLKWIAVELTADNREAIYIPKGCAHGFQTTADDTELLYQMNDYFAPEAAAGVRWNDPLFSITWPIAEPILSERDANYLDYATSGAFALQESKS